MSTTQLRFFGPGAALNNSGQPVPIRSRKQLALLAYLATEHSSVHSRETLLALFWPEEPTTVAQNNLRVTLSRLRELASALVAPDPLSAELLITDRTTVQLNPAWIDRADVNCFNRLIEQTRRHAHAQRDGCALCQEPLRAAVQLAQGDFLAGLGLADCSAFEEWLLMQRERLPLLALEACADLATFAETSGDLSTARTYAQRQIELDPLGEAAYRQLMRVLARADQRSAALEVYENCRRVLATELGLAPAVETVTLAEQIRARAPFEAAAIQPALPPVLTRFFGRQQESTELVELLAGRTVRLVTLAGPGGVGKTRLALEVAHRLAGVFTHNICLVELAGVADERSVDDAVAAALRLPTNTGRSSTAAIVNYLRDKTMLLVLDNCEHLVKTCTRLVQALCREASGLTVLATSRSPLQLAEEQVVRLEPLSTPPIKGAERLTVVEALRYDSIQLFTNRAAQALLQFVLTDTNVLAVARICQQLDGIPLAIEIAAAQTRALPIVAIAERLGQRFTWLNRRAAETLPRQRTLRMLIDWSYSLLSVPARTLLRRLAVFASGWTLEAAEAVSAPGEPCAELLTELVDHSLVIFGADAERRRYSMHETIRQFAQEQLRGSDQEAVVQERHARYYAQLVCHATENRAGQTLPERLRTVQDDHDNLGVAFEWLLAHDGEQALMVVAQLAIKLNFWELGGFFQEGRRWLQRALETNPGAISSARAQALLAAADLSSAICDFDYGLQAIQSAQAIFQQLGDQRGEVDARLDYCNLADLAGKHIPLQEQVEAAIQLAERISYTAGIARGKLFLGTLILYANGDFDTAIHYVLPSVALWREQQNSFKLASALTWLGVILYETEQFAAARQPFEESRAIFQALGYRRGIALALHNLGETAYKLGEYASARELLCESLRIRHHLSLPRGYTYSFEGLAQVDESEEHPERAVQLWAAAASLRNRIGAPLEQAAQKHATAALTRLRERLGEVIFALEWAKGQQLTSEQAIALALS